MIVTRGIDVSHHQGTIDFGKVKKAGIQFAILRAGYGWKDREKQTDRCFSENYRMAAEAGLPCGAYHYSYATTPQEAEQEADFFLSLTAGKRFGYPLSFDIEDKTQAALSREALADIVIAFCDKVERAGCYVCYYSNLDWVKNRLNSERLKRFDLWLARYNTFPGYEGIGMWQYSNRGRISGIGGNVDLDFAYKNYPAIMAEKGLNGYPKPSAAKPQAAKRYTVKSGDTMSEIAVRYGVSLQALIRANPQVKDPDRIWPGNVLTIPN